MNWTRWDELKHWFKYEVLWTRVYKIQVNPTNNHRVKGHRFNNGSPVQCMRCGIVVHLRRESIVTWNNGYATHPERLIMTCDEELVRQVYDT